MASGFVGATSPGFYKNNNGAECEMDSYELEEEEELSFLVLKQIKQKEKDNNVNNTIVDNEKESMIVNKPLFNFANGQHSLSDFTISPYESVKNLSSQEGSVVENRSNTTTMNSKLEHRDSLELNGLNDNINVNNSVSLGSLSNSMMSGTNSSLEEITNQIGQLKAENCHLKDSLIVMNENMKKNLSMFQDWQMTISSVQDEQKRKHNESKATVNKLREENDMLKSEYTLAKSNWEEKKSCENENDYVKLESLEQTLMGTKTELTKVQQQLEDYCSQLQEEQLQNHRLKELIRISNAQKAEDASLDMMKKSSASDNKDKEILTLHEIVESSRAMVEKLEAEKRDSKKLETDLDQAEMRLGEIIKENSLKDEEILKYKLKYEEAEVIIKNLRIALQRAEEDKNQMRIREATIKAENDDIELLRAQKDQYELDFNQERESREKMAAEKDDLQQLATNLKQALESKEEEIKRIQSNRIRFATDIVESTDGGSFPSSNNIPSVSASAEPSALGSFVNFFKHDLLGFNRMDTEETEQSASAPSVPGEAAENNDNSLSSQFRGIPPCPICGSRFHSQEALEYHSATCGESHTEPFHFP